MFSANQVWTGQQTSRVAAAARPSLDDVGAPVRVVRVEGTLDQFSLVGTDLAIRQARRDRSVRAIVLAIDSAAGLADVGDVLDAVRATRESKCVFAFVRKAVGSSLLLAAECTRPLVATPISQLGLLRTIDEQRDSVSLDWSRSIYWNRAILGALVAIRVDLAGRTCARLAAGIINGEQAEASGLVDALVQNEAQFLSWLSNEPVA